MPGKYNNHHLCFFSLPHVHQLSSGYFSSVNIFRILISSSVFISLVPTLTFITSMLRITLYLLGLFQIPGKFLFVLTSNFFVFSDTHLQCFKTLCKLLHLFGCFIFVLQYSKTNSLVT